MTIIMPSQFVIIDHCIAIKRVDTLSRIIVIIIGLTLPCCLKAQGYTLNDCIRKASATSSLAKTAAISADIMELTLKSAGNAYIPSLSLSNQHNFSTGRVLDPTTYQFLSNRSVYDNSFSIGATLTLFSGFERYYSIQKAEYGLQSAILEKEKIRNDLSLKVTALFLELLLDKEAIAICNSKLRMLEEQEALIARKVELKTLTPGDLLNVQADIANTRVDLVVAENALSIDKVSMCELLEIDNWQDFAIVAGDNIEMNTRCLWCEDDIVSSAFDLPQIKQKELAIETAKKEVKIASSSFWPTVALHVGYGSTYSSARTKQSGDAYSFSDQFRDNTSSYVALSLSIPILSSISVSNTLKQKQLAYTRAEYELTQAKLSLDREVKQAIINANTSYEKYVLLATDVEKFKEALRQTQEKYNAGAATYYDYQISVEKLFQAETQLLQSKYEYFFRTKIIDFYTGDPIVG